jgi:hypothetical protein
MKLQQIGAYPERPTPPLVEEEVILEQTKIWSWDPTGLC